MARAKTLKTGRKRKLGGDVKLPRSVRRMFPKVKFAADAKDNVEVSVCRADVDKAEKRNPAECALAKAFKRELHADGAIIGLSSSYIIKGDMAIRFATPESVRREIETFDRHSDFETGTYSLPPKSPSNRLGVHVDPRKDHGSPGSRKMKHIRLRNPKVRFLPKSAVEFGTK